MAIIFASVAGARAIAVALLMFVATAAEARSLQHPRRFTDPNLDAALVVNANTNTVLYMRNAAAIRHPASLTKMMTLYLLFEQLQQHKIALTAELPVSVNAAKQPRSHLRLRAGRHDLRGYRDQRCRLSPPTILRWRLLNRLAAASSISPN